MPCLILWTSLSFAAAPSLAVEIESEASANRQFVYLTSDVKQELLDERLTLGAGYTMIGDGHAARHGARALAEIELAPVSASASFSYAPRQDGRGWLAVELHGSHRLERGRVSLTSDGGLTQRRADIGVRKSRAHGESEATLAVNAIEGALSLSLAVDERWELAAQGSLSFYDADLASRRLRGSDDGLLVAIAGRPERWAAGGRMGWQITARWHVEWAVSFLSFADGSGGGWLPRFAVKTGPWRWFTVEAGVEALVTNEAGPPLLIGSLGVVFHP